MLLWLDLRFLKNDLYSNFILELIQNLIINNWNNRYTIYINSDNKDNTHISKLSLNKNCKIKIIEIKNFSLKEQIHFLKILNNDKNNLTIFFNHFKPIFYRWNYYTFVLSLKNIYYWNFKSSLSKYKYIFLLEKNLEKSEKIICFDNNTKNELTERFNIKEEKINIIHWFFKDSLINKLDIWKNEINIDIKAKYWIKNNYLIYAYWDWIEKNIEKLIQIYDKINKNTDLIILWDKISKNIFLRNKIINLNLQNRIKFVSQIKNSEIPLLYKQSIWTIFPSLYETFPFELSNAIKYNIPIIASDLTNLKNIFWDTIKYFSPISRIDMIKQINKFIQNNTQNKEYNNIIKNYSLSLTSEQLIKIIN